MFQKQRKAVRHSCSPGGGRDATDFNWDTMLAPQARLPLEVWNMTIAQSQFDASRQGKKMLNACRDRNEGTCTVVGRGEKGRL